METPELKAQPDELEFESTHTTPRRKIDSKPVHTDSLVTIPLSEASQSRPTTISIESEDGDIVESPVGLEDLHNDIRSTTSSDRSYDEKRSTGAASSSLNLEEEMASGLDRRLSVVIDAGRARSDSSASQSSLQVDWEQLDKTEAQEEEEADDDEVCSHYPFTTPMNYSHSASKPLCYSHVLSRRTTRSLRIPKRSPRIPKLR